MLMDALLNCWRDWSSKDKTALLKTLEKQTDAQETAHAYERFQTDPIGYAEQVLEITPWPGSQAKGQRELFADIGESVRKQLAGEPTHKIFRVEAGNGIGKTYGGAALVNWFFDCFVPSVTITTAPTKPSVVELLWKDIKKQRDGRGLPGRVLPSEAKMERGSHHFAIGKTTSDAGGKGEERFKGQHDNFLFFVLDEAEGLAKFVYDAVRRMMTGGQVIIVLILANPRTRTSEFFKWGQKSDVVNYRLSALDHPNILTGRDMVPGATSREWVNQCIEDWCEEVSAHNEDAFTFEVPWRTGKIFLPNSDFLCSVMGIPPSNSSIDTFVPTGRYEAAVQRGQGPVAALEEILAEWGCHLRFGVDVARWGNDSGTIYARLGPLVWRVGKVSKQDYIAYAGVIREEALRIAAIETARQAEILAAFRASEGLDAEADLTDVLGAPVFEPLSLHIRVDAGGGFGGGVIDQIKNDADLTALFPDFQTFEVNFAAKVNDAHKYALFITELYADAAESLKGVTLLRAPAELGPDLTERKFMWKNVGGVAVKQLEPKEELRKPRRLGRSPDDGDGCVLAMASDFLFDTPFDYDFF